MDDPRKWVQIYDYLLNQILDGTLKPRDGCPPIGDLSQQWGTCRQTVSKALRTLEDEGLIRRYPGHGYIVQARSREQPSPSSPRETETHRG